MGRKEAVLERSHKGGECSHRLCHYLSYDRRALPQLLLDQFVHFVVKRMHSNGQLVSLLPARSEWRHLQCADLILGCSSDNEFWIVWTLFVYRLWRWGSSFCSSSHWQGVTAVAVLSEKKTETGRLAPKMLSGAHGPLLIGEWDWWMFHFRNLLRISVGEVRRCSRGGGL